MKAHQTRIYRFHDLIAVSFYNIDSGHTQTVYVTPEMVHAIAPALQKGAGEIQAGVSFSESTFPTHVFMTNKDGSVTNEA